MKKAIFYFAFILVFNSIITAQNWQWAKDMGSGMGVDIKTDFSGNIYVLSGTGTGYSYGSNTLSCGNAGTLAKHDALGNIVWARGFNFQVGHLSLDKIGNIYVTGAFQIWNSSTPNSFCGGNNPDITVNSQGGSDMFICKYNNNGDLLWAKIWDNSGGNDYPTASKNDWNGNTYIAGKSSLQTNPYAAASLDHFLLKYDSLGNLLWSKTNNWKGSMITKGLDVDNNGSFYISGNFADSAFFDNISFANNGQSTIYIAKFNSNGNVIWAKKDGTGYDECNDLCLDKKGNFFITGTTGGLSTFSGTTLVNSGVIIVKYDTLGNAVWAKNTYSGQGLAMDVDTSANCFVTGFFSHSINFNSQSTLNSLKNGEVFIAKYDKGGNFKWGVSPSGSNGSNNGGYGLCLDKKKNCFITGCFVNTTSFGNTTLFSNQNYTNIFIAKLKDSSFTVITEINQIENPVFNLKIFPNPTKNVLAISYSSSEKVKQLIVEVKNIAGQIMFHGIVYIDCNDFEPTINMEKYPKGLYFIEVTPIFYSKNESKIKFSKKIVLE